MVAATGHSMKAIGIFFYGLYSIILKLIEAL